MHRITKLLIASIAFASVQTLNVAVFRNLISIMSATFCWLVVALVAWKRSGTLKV